MRYEISSIEPSAQRHGISDERIRHVVAHHVTVVDEPVADLGEDDIIVLLGYDQDGNALEVAGVAVEAGSRRTRLRIMHAMKLRRKYLSDYIVGLDS